MSNTSSSKLGDAYGVKEGANERGLTTEEFFTVKEIEVYAVKI